MQPNLEKIMLSVLLGAPVALVAKPITPSRGWLGQPQMVMPSIQLAGVAAAVVIASTPAQMAEAAVAPTAIEIEQKAEMAAFESAKAEAKAQVKAQLARGAPAKLPSAATASDVSVALRSTALKLDPRDLRLPNSIGVTLPVVGPLRIDLNVQISKVTEVEVANADVVVSLPKDLVKASKLAAGGVAGLAIDAPGVASGRFDLDVTTPVTGEADIAISSKLIPKLPLQKTKGLGRFCFECGNGNPDSEWFIARNLGSGVQFYGNARTGLSQFESPKGF